MLTKPTTQSDASANSRDTIDRVEWREPLPVARPVPSMPAPARSRTPARTTLRDLNSNRVIDVFRRPTFWQRVRQLLNQVTGHKR